MVENNRKIEEAQRKLVSWIYCVFATLCKRGLCRHAASVRPSVTFV